MRTLALASLFLTACFSGYAPNVYDDRFGSSSQASSSSSCAELCDDDCGDIKTASAREACVAACLASCASDKESCPRPEPETQCKTQTCTAPKAALCEKCAKNDDCAGTGALCLGATESAPGFCGQKCVVDCDCPAEYECRGVVDPKTGRFDSALGRQCVPEVKQCPQCKLDADCEDGNICEAGKCVAACAGDDQCQAGERCFEDGRCAIACCLDTDCAAGFACNTGRCVKK